MAIYLSPDLLSPLPPFLSFPFALSVHLLIVCEEKKEGSKEERKEGRREGRKEGGKEGKEGNR